MSNFVTDCINADALLEEIDDYIDKWHNSKSQLPIYTYLGMTEKEYGLWVSDDSILKYIILAHERQKDISDVLDECYSNTALAARSSNTAANQKIVEWLRKLGKI